MFTLVTACKNREEHLRLSLENWLKIPRISEIIIVDWSNSIPLYSLEEIDSRIKVLRVENESRWILSYAYNFGISYSSNFYILKIDADCTPDKKITELIPGSRHFFAGYWKSGHLVNKASVNGQCVITKKQFEEVNGYSELIRTYGRDDEDLYDRLILNKNSRIEIPTEFFKFINHDDILRTNEQFSLDKTKNPRDYVISTPAYNEMRNFYIGRNYVWDKKYNRSSYIEELNGKQKYYIRDMKTDIKISSEIDNLAHLFSLRYLTAQILRKTMNDTVNFSEDYCWDLILNYKQ